MGRHFDADSQYRIRPHKTHGYTYASTQLPTIDPRTGKKKYRHVHWGTVDENLVFTPGSTFYLASPEERARLIFPKDWDIGKAKKLTGLRKPGRPAYDGECRNRLYGDIWLLEQVAEKTGIRRDLMAVFNEDREIVDDILTLAMFPYLTRFNYSRVARWQQVAASPSSRYLTPTEITRLTQSITEQHYMDLLKLRAARLAKDELCAVDSTSRSAYGSGLADIRWGKNKDHLPLAQTTEVVVYALSGQSMVMCAKTSQRDVVKAIRELGEFGARPEGMAIDPEAKIYYKQCDIDYVESMFGKSAKASDRLKLNLYFDPVRRGLELIELDITLSAQETALRELLESRGVLGEDVVIKREYCYYKITYDPVTKAIRSFELDEKKVAKARSLSGFFSIMTHGLEFDASAEGRAGEVLPANEVPDGF